MVATLTFLPFILSSSVIALTALDFLGLGLPPGSPSLGDLLRQLGEMLSGRINASVTVHIIGKFILPTKVQLVFYRVCQEALENVVIHNASQVEINLQHVGDVIELRIRDNGRIFDSEQAQLGYPGLDMVVERAEALGAQLRVNSRPGYGTEVKLDWKTPQNWTP